MTLNSILKFWFKQSKVSGIQITLNRPCLTSGQNSTRCIILFRFIFWNLSLHFLPFHIFPNDNEIGWDDLMFPALNSPRLANLCLKSLIKSDLIFFFAFYPRRKSDKSFAFFIYNLNRILLHEKEIAFLSA